METVPNKVGATIRRHFTHRPAGSQDMYYVRDSGGVWHYWDFSGRNLSIRTDADMVAKTNEGGDFKVISEGYTPPVAEPTGLGAVVTVDSGFGVETKFVRADTEFDADSWMEVGSEVWVHWDHIAEQTNIRVLSQGV